MCIKFLVLQSIIWDNLGLSALPRGTSACHQEEAEIKPKTLRSQDIECSPLHLFNYCFIILNVGQRANLISFKRRLRLFFYLCVFCLAVSYSELVSDNQV